MKEFIKNSLRKQLMENADIDDILDRISDVGIGNLTELEKLKLGVANNDDELLNRIQLGKLFKENGGTFGNYKIKVIVKPIEDQLIDHNISKEYAGEEGYLSPYFHRDDKGELFLKVQFDKQIKPSPEDNFTNDSAPIYLKNLKPIGYR